MEDKGSGLRNSAKSIGRVHAAIRSIIAPPSPASVKLLSTYHLLFIT